MTPKVDGSLMMTKHLEYILTVIFAKYKIAPSQVVATLPCGKKLRVLAGRNQEKRKKKNRKNKEKIKDREKIAESRDQEHCDAS